MENLLKNTSLLNGKTAYIDRNIWKSNYQIKWLWIAVIRVLNRLLYNLNNGLHLQERKNSE